MAGASQNYWLGAFIKFYKKEMFFSLKKILKILNKNFLN